MATKLNFTQINALAKSELEVFTNSFSYHNDDYFHKNVGSLFGVIQVADYSKNSEYLPNLLTSILKKTFYSNAHKTTEQNFELALKKANLALADLAEHDIVEWNKNLHALVGVIHKDKLFFTQVGNALISIGRDDKIMHLSEPETNTPHPIKTFQDIIVGKIELGDKIIISTPTMLDIFKFDDINRLFKTFSAKEFDDIFFKTLRKEGSNISAVIVNIESEKELDYSKSKSLNNEELPLEELTKNKNFLGEETKPRKKETENSSIALKNKLNAGAKVKKSDKTKVAAKIKNKKRSKEFLSKKQALDIAQKEAAAVKSKTSTEKNKKLTTPIIQKPVTPVTPILKTATTAESTTTEKIKPKKGKSAHAKIKSISSATHRSTVKTQIPKTKESRKLNDLKDTAGKKTPHLSTSPFEELKEIYIKDDSLVEKAKKPSTKKLKSFFHKPDISKKESNPSIQTQKTIGTKPNSTSFKPKTRAIANPSPSLENISSNIPIQKENNLHTPSNKQTPAVNLDQKILLNVFSTSLKKIKKILKGTNQAILKFIKNAITFLKNLANKKEKPFGTIPSSHQQSSSSLYTSQAAQQTNNPSFLILIKKVVFKSFLFVQLIAQKISPFFKPLFRIAGPFVKKYRTALLIILFILLVPIIIGTITKSKRNKETAEKLKLPEAPIVNETKSAIENINQTRKILSLSTTIKLLAENDNVLIAYTEDSQLYEIDKKTNKPKKLTIPKNIKLAEIKAIDYIESLNLFFLSSGKATISYSPKVKKFIPNKITLPPNFKLAGQNTYLSYLYLLDASSKQIYRYPRATGGFDVSKKWLTTSLTHNAEPSAMAIDENVRVAYLDGTVEKYSKGKLLNTKKFELKSLDFIKTTEDFKSYYLLSKDEGKILKINKSNDSIEKEYQNAAIQDTTTFTVDEETKLLHIFSGKELLSIDL